MDSSRSVHINKKQQKPQFDYTEQEVEELVKMHREMRGKRQMSPAPASQATRASTQGQRYHHGNSRQGNGGNRHRKSGSREADDRRDASYGRRVGSYDRGDESYDRGDDSYDTGDDSYDRGDDRHRDRRESGKKRYGDNDDKDGFTDVQYRLKIAELQRKSREMQAHVNKMSRELFTEQELSILKHK